MPPRCSQKRKAAPSAGRAETQPVQGAAVAAPAAAPYAIAPDGTCLHELIDYL
jgi:hypothetical protein